MRPALLTLALCACSDYNLEPNKPDPDPIVDSEPPPDSPADSPVDSPEESTPLPESEPQCEDRSFPGGTLGKVESCRTETESGTFTPVEEWSYDTWSVEASSASLMMTPIIVPLTDDDGDGDIDADDTPDIVLVTYPSTSWTSAGVLRALHGDGSGEIFNTTGSGIAGCSGLAGGDLDGDGLVELVGITTSGQVIAFEHDGTLAWKSATYSGAFNTYSAMPAISDMDADGQPEIVVGALILNADGTLRGEGAWGSGGASSYGSSSFAVDLDRDGVQEVVTGNALYDPDGNTIWTNGLSDGYVAVADFDGDTWGDVVVVSSAQVRLQDAFGTVVWKSAIPKATSGYGGPPTIADFDGDGEPEVGVAANSTYTVFDTDGALLWQATSQDSSSGVTGSAVFDFEGDGVAEAIYPDELTVWGFNGPDGSVKLSASGHSSWTVNEYAPIVDVDNDGEAEIVVVHSLHPSYASSAVYGVTVYGDADHTWREGPRIWNQYAFHMTNIEEDGTVPVSAALNWDSYNNFRSGDLLAGTIEVEQVDLIPWLDDVCAECEAGRVWVWGRPGNQGWGDVDAPFTMTPTAQTAAGDVVLDTVVVSSGVAEGELLGSVVFNGDITGLEVQDLWLEVDTLGEISECIETNNRARWGAGVCL